MPVRQIGKSYRNLTGQIVSLKNNRQIAFESGLERDLISILEFDILVDEYEEQPLAVDYQTNLGNWSSYTPDFLIRWRTGIFGDKHSSNWLCEVKYRQDLFENWAKYKPKFKAARRYAHKHGMVFRILTENEIKTPVLENARFFLRYKNVQTHPFYEEKLLFWIHELRETTPQGLLEAAFNSKVEKAKAIPTLWKLLLDRRIATDFNRPMSMNSKIWLVEEECLWMAF